MVKHTTISEFLDSLEDNQRTQVEFVRKIILNAEPELAENIKWNALNYVYKQHDRLTFTILNKEKKVALVLHKGTQEKEDKKAKPIMNEESGMVKWLSNIRGIIIFDDLEEITQNAPKLKEILIQWLRL